MAGDFGYRTLGDVAAIQTGPFGSQLHAQDYKQSGVPVVMPTNIVGRRIDSSTIAKVSQADADRLSRHKLQVGDIVFSRRGEIDKCALVTKENEGWLCGTGCLLARVDEVRSISKYIAFHISSPETRAWLKAHAVGLVMPNLNTGILERLPLRLPPIHQQEAIADLLGLLDDKIELHRRMAETLEAMARALFKSWFVDFDPVHAKTEGRSTGLRDDVTALFPNNFDAEGLPGGWRNASLRDLAILNPESWTKATILEKIEYVDLANTKWGRIEAVQTFPNSEAPSRAQRVLRPGDTIVGIVRPGNGSFAHIQTEGLTGSTGFAVLRPISPNRSSLVYLAATARENIESLAFLADGAAYPAVNPTDVIDTRLILPEADIIDAFDAVTTPLLLAIHGRLEQSRTLANLRDTLLPKLISGELRIADAEAKVSAA